MNKESAYENWKRLEAQVWEHKDFVEAIIAGNYEEWKSDHALKVRAAQDAWDKYALS